LERHVEEDSMHFISEAAGHLDPLASLMWRQIGCVDIVPRHFRYQSRTQQRAQCRKYKPLIALFRDVVEQNAAQHVAGKRRDSAAFEPGRLARSRQSNRQDDVTLWRFRGL